MYSVDYNRDQLITINTTTGAGSAVGTRHGDVGIRNLAIKVLHRSVVGTQAAQPRHHLDRQAVGSVRTRVCDDSHLLTGDDAV